ncbi:MAG: efflux transporter, RND family [Parcubacteria bacterium C7867-001]|nr:MAG: efflux transporter, RND family [Parcubacteria bacterium C7867-001]
MVSNILAGIRQLFSRVVSSLGALYKRYRSLRPRYQIGIAVLVVILLGSIGFLLGSNKAASDTNAGLRSVSVATVAELSGSGSGTSILGTVRSVSEAELLAQAGGAVRSVRANVGDSVPAGFVIVALENDTESASVLSAEGAYEAALAASQTVAPEQVKTNALNAYTSAYATLDTTLSQYVDTFFGDEGAFGPELLVSASSVSPSQMSRERRAIAEAMDVWQKSLPTAATADPNTLLANAVNATQKTTTLLTELAQVSSERSSNVSATQLTALATARSTVNTLLSTIASAQASYKSQSQANTGGNASVKQALGALRLAQANYEKTIIRAPIAGTINFLPVHVGDYVSNLEHVATVAQNGALEIDAFVSEENRSALAVGTKVAIEGEATGLVTQISPALDPITKQIDIRIAVTGTSSLLNGQSVRITLPGAPVKQATATTTIQVLLPLTAVKLSANSREVFTVGTDGRLIALPVTIGDVIGDRISITSSLPIETSIVTDARGLSEGQKVNVAPPTI